MRIIEPIPLSSPVSLLLLLLPGCAFPCSSTTLRTCCIDSSSAPCGAACKQGEEVEEGGAIDRVG